MANRCWESNAFVDNIIVRGFPFGVRYLMVCTHVKFQKAYNQSLHDIFAMWSNIHFLDVKKFLYIKTLIL